jgi:hypothetical protein
VPHVPITKKGTSPSSRSAFMAATIPISSCIYFAKAQPSSVAASRHISLLGCSSRSWTPAIRAPFSADECAFVT